MQIADFVNGRGSDVVAAEPLRNRASGIERLARLLAQARSIQDAAEQGPGRCCGCCVQPFACQSFAQASMCSLQVSQRLISLRQLNLHFSAAALVLCCSIPLGCGFPRRYCIFEAAVMEMAQAGLGGLGRRRIRRMRQGQPQCE